MNVVPVKNLRDGHPVRSLSGKMLPFDLASLGVTGPDALAGGWPTPPATYRALSQELAGVCAAAGRAAAVGDAAIALECKIGDIVLDLLRLARLTIDLTNAAKAGARPVYDAVSSPVAAWLAEGAEGDPSAAWRHWPEQPLSEPPLPRLRNVGLRAYRTLQMTRGISREFDLLNANTLSAEFLSNSAESAVNLHPRLFDWPGLHPPTVVHETSVADAIGAAFKTWLEANLDLEHEFCRRVSAAAVGATCHHLSMALADLAYLRRALPERRLARRLITGTPKYYGRLISWYYRDNGREVLRFAHGGERVFFVDRNWSLTEFPFADRYFAHSGAEAANIVRRLGDGRMCAAGPPGQKFESFGSAKHLHFARASVVASTRDIVVYLPSQYLGEAQAPDPGFRVPDPPYHEWQVWLLQTIRALGYRVICKVHPRGLARHNALLAPHADAVVDAPFDAITAPPGCLLFDFAGSAFFDALATSRGVVFVDRGDRPIDSFARSDLAARCALVGCHVDEAHRTRLAPAALKEAISKATDHPGASQDFINRYFGP